MIKGDDSAWLFPGELKRTHGAKEFNRLVQNGTFVEGKDDKGNQKFRKQTEIEASRMEHSKSLSAEQSRGIDDEEMTSLQNAMAAKMRSGKGLDGCEFLSLLGMGADLQAALAKALMEVKVAGQATNQARAAKKVASRPPQAEPNSHCKAKR